MCLNASSRLSVAHFSFLDYGLPTKLPTPWLTGSSARAQGGFNSILSSPVRFPRILSTLSLQDTPDGRAYRTKSPYATMQWLLCIVIPLVFAASWLYTVSVVESKFPRLRNKRICLLIAHPDDEAMFFAPTLLALTQPALGNHVKILCLSSGQ